MKCPQSKELEELLANSDADDPSGALWSHLESCRFCQAELDRLSDDVELTRWRRRSRAKKSFEDDAVRDIPACREMVNRLTKMDTSVDSGSQRQTIGEESQHSEFPLQFSQSEFDDDLGMLGHYRIRRRIGQGGMAFVVEAIDTQLDRVIALKILRPDLLESFSKERFEREAKSIAGVHHPNVIAIHGISSTPSSSPFIAMELMAGGCLQDRIRQEAGIAPRQAAEWIAQIADGLSAAHQAGLIHRDIKPSNVLLSDAIGSVAKLADFGLARSISVANSVTQTGVLLGTPSYMSPEHVLNPESIDARSDIYGLGLTLYETLTGEVPFRGALHTVLARIVSEDPTPPRNFDSTIPRDLETVCLKAMHRDPARRYATSSDFALDLRRWLNGETIVARPASAAEKLIRWCQRKPGVAGLVGTVAMLLVVLAIGSIYTALSIRGAETLLRTEKENVDRANVKIQATANEAKRQRQLAIESLNSLVTKVQTTLASRPGTIELRSDILKTALQGLERITSDSESMQFDPTTIEAHCRQGEVLDLLGRTSEAIIEFDKAVELAKSANQADPNDKLTNVAWGNALMARGDAHRKAFDYEQAKLVYEQILPIRKKIADEFSEDGAAEHGLAICMQRIADIQFNRNDFQAAAVSYGKLLQHNLAASNRHPDDLELKRSLGMAYERMGTVSTSIRSPSNAKEYFQKAVGINTSLLEMDPGSKLYKTDLAYFTKCMATLASSQGEHDDATRLAKSAIGYYLAVANADPQDAESRMKVGSSWDTLFAAHRAAEEYSDAIIAVKSGLEVFAELTKQYPTAAKYPTLAMEACTKLMDVQIRQGQLLEAADSMRRRAEFVENWRRSTDAGKQDFDAAKSWSISTATTLSLAALGLEAIEAKQDVEPDSAYASKVIAAYTLARQGEVGNAMAACEILMKYTASDPGLGASGKAGLARTYAICFRQLKQRQTNEPASPIDPKTELALAGCAEAVGSLVKQNQAYRSYLSTEIDLIEIALEPGFREMTK